MIPIGLLDTTGSGSLFLLFYLVVAFSPWEGVLEEAVCFAAEFFDEVCVDIIDGD